MKHLLACIVLALTASLEAVGQNGCLPVLSGSVRFSILQMGAPFEGGFERFGGEVCWDAGRIVSIDAWLDPASVHTGLPDLDQALQADTIFASGEHARITYRSDKVGQDDRGHRAQGTLTMKGRARPVAVLLREEGDTLRGEVAIDRLDFGVGTGEWAQVELLGNTVAIEFEVRVR